MKKRYLLIIIFIGLTSCQKQKVSGIWLSYNHRTINKYSYSSRGYEGMFIDFNKSEIGAIWSDSLVKIKLDFENGKITSKKSELTGDFEMYDNDSLEIISSKNRIAVFRPLNMNNKLDNSKSDLIEFLTTNCIQKFHNGLKVEFTNEICPFEINQKVRALNCTFNNGETGVGLWGISEIDKNFILFFKSEGIDDLNIFQITSMDMNKLQLDQLQEAELGSIKLNQLKTCL